MFLDHNTANFFFKVLSWFSPFYCLLWVLWLHAYTENLYNLLFPFRRRSGSVLFKVPSWHHQGTENLQRRQTAKGEKPQKPWHDQSCHSQEGKGFHDQSCLTVVQLQIRRNQERCIMKAWSPLSLCPTVQRHSKHCELTTAWIFSILLPIVHCVAWHTYWHTFLNVVSRLWRMPSWPSTAEWPQRKSSRS